MKGRSERINFKKLHRESNVCKRYFKAFCREYKTSLVTNQLLRSSIDIDKHLVALDKAQFKEANAFINRSYGGTPRSMHSLRFREEKIKSMQDRQDSVKNVDCTSNKSRFENESQIN